jgi:peptidyl-prolyl cis-trans isomerase SurA
MFLAVSAVLLLAAGSDRDVRVVEEIVAKVNNDIITRGELEKQGADTLEQRIDQLLLVQKGKDLNIKVDGEVTRRLAEYQVESKISDPDKFREWVRDNSGGLSYEDVRQNMSDLFVTQTVIREEVGSKIVVSQAEIEKYYNAHMTEFVRQEMVFLREILVAPTDASPAAWAAAEKKAQGLFGCRDCPQ